MNDDDLLRTAAVPPPVGSEEFLRNWDSIRDGGIAPLNVSTLDGSESGRAEFLKGAELIRLTGDRAKKDKRTGKPMTPRPAQLMISDAVNGADRFMGVLAPRRSTKTSALFAVAMGRIATREDYHVSYTMATTALKARARFKADVAAPLEYLYPDKRTRPFAINYAGGSESVRCLDTGSLLQFGAPKGDAYRSDAWDLMIVDEAGEAEPEMTDDLIAGALSTMDTIPDALLIAAGTAGLFRDGNLLWETLEDGRAKRNRTAIIEYASPATTTLRDIETWEQAVPLLLGAHPGIGNGTTLEDLEANFNKLKREQFLREYHSIFAKLGGSSFIDVEHWGTMAAGGDLPTPPSHFRLAFAVHPLQTSAAILAVWRVNGKAHGLVVDHRPGVSWLYKRLLELERKFRVPITYDAGNNVNTSEAEKLQRAKPRPKLEPQNWNAVSTAAASILKEIDAGNVVHYGQPMLDEAIRVAVKRGNKESKRWGFGRGTVEENDITPLEAFSIGLRAYDESKPRVPIQIITADAA